VPVHTYGPPDAPDRPESVDGYSSSSMRFTIYMGWELPLNNGEAVLESVLYIRNESSQLPTQYLPCEDGVCPTSYNLTGLLPATQYGATVAVRNAVGWSDNSSVAWLWTSPDRPNAPAEPNCAEFFYQDGYLDYLPLATTNESIYVELANAEDNGLAVTSVELMVTNSSAFLADVFAAPSVTTTTFINVTYGVGGVAISPSSDYVVRSRARNLLGWSDWSKNASCSSAPPAPPPTPIFPWWTILIILVCVILCMMCCGVYCYKTEIVGKVIAPKLRRKRAKEVQLEDYMSSDFMPMEDEDPDLTVNPVLAAKIAHQKDRDRRAKKKGGLGGGTGRAGGLKRLNINFGPVDEKKQQKAQTNARKQIDDFLGVAANEGGGDQQRAAGKEGEKKLKKRMEQMQQRKGSATQSAGAGIAGARSANAAAKRTTNNSDYSEKL